MKRKALEPSSKKTTKKQRLQKLAPTLEPREPEHIRDEAEPYRLATAVFCINSLSPIWSTGANRSINEAHVRRLCARFSEVGVLRKDASHRLLVLATKAEVQAMLKHNCQQTTPNIRAASDGSSGERELPCQSFQQWRQVVGQKAELIAGHHRVEALRLYLSKFQASEEEAWWVCDVYDKGNQIQCTLACRLIMQTHCRLYCRLDCEPIGKIRPSPTATARYGLRSLHFQHKMLPCLGHPTNV
jgi:hypothetical protein